MEFEQYFNDFCLILQTELEQSTSNRINGVSRFKEFLLEKQRRGELLPEFDDYSDEEIIELAGEEVDALISYVKSEYSDVIEIVSETRWVLVKKDTNIETGEARKFILSEENNDLLNKNVTNLNEDDLNNIKYIYSKLSEDDKNERARCLTKIAEYGYQESNNISNAEDWLNAAVANQNNNQKILAYDCYRRAGSIYSRENYFKKSAQAYKSAIDTVSYSQLDESKKEKYKHIVRECRLQYDRSGLNNEAAEIFIRENDITLQSSSLLKKIILTVYKLVSNYGESPLRVVSTGIFVVFISALFYTWLGIKVSGGGVIHSFGTSLYFSLVTFTTLGYGDLSPQGGVRGVATIEALLGLIVTSLFMVTLVRKYSR